MDDRDLTRLMHDAVSDVEPADRLGEIRERTARPPRRVGWYAGGGAVLAAAAAVTAVAVVTSTGTPQADDPEPLATPAPTTTPPTTTPPETAHPTPVYYLGPGSDGPEADEALLYRYYEGSDVSIVDALTSTPRDPDYRTLWPSGSFVGVGDPEAGESVVQLGDSFPTDRPEDVTTREVELSLQQVAYTVRAHYGEDISIRLVDRSGPVEQVWGVATPGGVVTAAPQLEVLSHMSISDPVEGLVVQGSFIANGRANGFEGTVGCRLLTGSGQVVWEKATIAGWQEEKLFAWQLAVDLTDVAPGTYQFWCSTDDPTGGTEGRGADTDTRTVVVR